MLLCGVQVHPNLCSGIRSLWGLALEFGREAYEKEALERNLKRIFSRFGVHLGRLLRQI